MAECIKCSKEIPDGAMFCPWCGSRQESKHTAKRRGNGQGTAIKRGKTWTAVWSTPTELNSDGTAKNNRHWKGGFASKSAALVYAATAEKPEIIKEYKPTLKDYHETYLKGAYLKLGKSKQCAMRIAWNRLEDLQMRPVKEITVAELQACIDDQATSYYTAKDCKTLLSHLYTLADAEGQARKNLSEFITLPPLHESEQQPFADEEIHKLWEASSQGDRIAEVIILMIYTGMMPGELRRLKIDMIDAERHEIVGCGLKTKKRKETPIVFPESITPIVSDLIATTESKEGYLLGMGADRFYAEYHKCLERVGTRDLPPYSCRHTTATALAVSKVAPSVIQEIMRHTKFATTQRYIHPNMDNAHAAMDALK